MQTITVNKQDLADKLVANRDQHAREYAEALEKRREQVIEALAKRRREVMKGGKIDLVFNFPEPQSFVESYDTAINMLKWEQGETVDLTQDDFERYVENRWEWQRIFAASTQSYNGR